MGLQWVYNGSTMGPRSTIAYAAPVSHITCAGSDDSSDGSSSGEFQHGGVPCPAGYESVSA
eukprot:12838668-Heterocapsa_arctica.AAC.1